MFCPADGAARILPQFLSFYLPMTSIHAGVQDYRHCERECMWQGTQAMGALKIFGCPGSNPGSAWQASALYIALCRSGGIDAC